MAERCRVDLIVEDAAQEQFAQALIERVADGERVSIVLSVRAARGGAPRALEKLVILQRGFRAGSFAAPVPDLLVIVIDADDLTWRARSTLVETVIDATVIPRVAVGCPEPCVEAWYLADHVSFARVAGVAPRRAGAGSRDALKKRLADSVEEAGVVSLVGGTDLAPELVADMDLFRAGKAEPSLKAFADRLRSALQDIARG